MDIPSWPEQRLNERFVGLSLQIGEFAPFLPV